MRHLCQVESEKDRNALIAFLWKNEIECQVYQDNQVWIYDENLLRRASELAKDFLKDPSKLVDVSPPAAVIPIKETKHPSPPLPEVQNEPAKAPKPKEEYSPQKPRFANIRSRSKHLGEALSLGGTASEKSTWLTWLFVILCVAATYLTELPAYEWLKPKLMFSEQYFSRDFPEIVAGQYWRLITPIFLHGNFMHILFNVMWLIQLGLQIELGEGKVRLLLITLFFGAACNCAQYVVSGPYFLGYSGVIYGLLGYIWMKAKYSRKVLYILPESTVYFMIIWLLVCLVGIFPGVANTQHVVGFLLGIAFGYTNAKAES